MMWLGLGWIPLQTGYPTVVPSVHCVRVCNCTRTNWASEMMEGQANYPQLICGDSGKLWRSDLAKRMQPSRNQTAVGWVACKLHVCYSKCAVLGTSLCHGTHWSNEGAERECTRKPRRWGHSLNTAFLKQAMPQFMSCKVSRSNRQCPQIRVCPT